MTWKSPARRSGPRSRVEAESVERAGGAFGRAYHAVRARRIYRPDFFIRKSSSVTMGARRRAWGGLAAGRHKG